MFHISFLLIQTLNISLEGTKSYVYEFNVFQTVYRKRCFFFLKYQF